LDTRYNKRHCTLRKMFASLLLSCLFLGTFSHKVCRPNPSVKAGCEVDFFVCQDKDKPKCGSHTYVSRIMSCRGESPCSLQTVGIEGRAQPRRQEPAPVAPKPVAPKPKPKPAAKPQPEGPGFLERTKDAFIQLASGNDGSAKKKNVQWAGNRVGDLGKGKCWCWTWRHGTCGSAGGFSDSAWPCGRHNDYDPAMENVFVTRDQLRSCCAKQNRNYRPPVQSDPAPPRKIPLPPSIQRFWAAFLDTARCVTVAQREAMIKNYLESNGCVGEHVNALPCLEAESSIRATAPRLCAGERETYRVGNSSASTIPNRYLVYTSVMLFIILFGVFVYSRRKARDEDYHTLLVVDVDEI